MRFANAEGMALNPKDITMRKRLFILVLAGGLLGGTACTTKTIVFQTGPATKPQAANTGKPVHVLISTSMGDIKVELYPDKAPVTVKNFLGYVDAKHYDSTLFHRVLAGNKIEGGGYLPGKDRLIEKLGGKPPIKNESDNGLSNERGTIAMVRPLATHYYHYPTPIEHEEAANSATTEFYINVVDNTQLDWQGPDAENNKPAKPGYCVFGKVTAGMDVVDKINAAKTAKKGHEESAPAEDVVITSIRRVD
jgi:cyclophilin family peptidyl-prolyl cis-trans isomerase